MIAVTKARDHLEAETDPLVEGSLQLGTEKRNTLPYLNGIRMEYDGWHCWYAFCLVADERPLRGSGLS
jgi:hypothetical protein